MFNHLHQIPLDPIFQLLADYNADPNPKKVNLGIGLYADYEGNPFVFPVVKKVFEQIDIHNFNYQPIGGNKDFLRLSAELLLPGCDQQQLALHTVCGGTQAMSLFRDLLKLTYAGSHVMIAQPTWPNQNVIFKAFERVSFDHLDASGEANVQAYREVVEKANPGDVLLIHGGLTHNPTGKNLSVEQWKSLIPLIRERQVYVYIDFAYLGFGEGMQEDRMYAQIFFDELDEVACGISFSKNASLYEHRVGVLIMKTANKKTVESQLQQLTREAISMAPGLGQEAMTYILRDHPEQWFREVDQVRVDMEQRKQLLLDQLPESFHKLKDCKGMFGLLPLAKEQVLRLRKEYSIYVTDNGRVNFAGIRPKEVGYVGEAMRRVYTP
ncbi:MAG: aminotransferase class I/II-fold pyridoxal phosphate-dependent enzyme [Candidatus Altimarinota bacterium]